MSAVVLSLSSTAVGCDPELRAATQNYYDLRNKKKLRNFITAEITAKSYFKFYVENLPVTAPRTGCPGRFLFQVVWEHFVAVGVKVLGIRGEWTFGVNLDEVNKQTANNALSLEVDLDWIEGNRQRVHNRSNFGSRRNSWKLHHCRCRLPVVSRLGESRDGTSRTRPFRHAADLCTRGQTPLTNAA